MKCTSIHFEGYKRLAKARCAWSKGGDSTLANCEMLCIFHNRSKGNL